MGYVAAKHAVQTMGIDEALTFHFRGLRQNLWVKNGPTGDSSWQGGFSEGWQGK